MQSNTEVLETNVKGAPVDWGRFRTWAEAEKGFFKNKMAEITLSAVTGAAIGVIMLSLYKAVQGAVYTGLGYAVFGTF